MKGVLTYMRFVYVLFFVVLLSATLFSCSNLKVPDPAPPFDVAAQYKIDSQLIVDYIEEYEIEGVQYTESGLAYIVLAEGEGPYPQKNDLVSVHYTISLLDSTVIATTMEDVAIKYDLYDSAGVYTPQTVNIGGDYVFSSYPMYGMKEGTQLMKLNDRFLFLIPSKLAFGTLFFKNLPANSVLVWEQKMVNIR